MLAQRVVDALARPWRHGERELRPGGTLGLTVFPEDPSEPEELLLHADRALYRAKERGRGGWARYGATGEAPGSPDGDPGRPPPIDRSTVRA